MKNKYNINLTETILLFAIISLVLALFISLNFNFKETKLIHTISEIQKIRSSVNKFQKKFGNLPGDINNTVLINLSKENTDGNVDDLITNYSISNVNYINNNEIFDGEYINFWKHLYETQLLEQENNYILPRVPLNTKKYFAVININNLNYILLGVNKDKDSKINLKEKSITPADAFLIDKKIDDSFADSGKILNFEPKNIENIELKNSCSSTFKYNTVIRKNICNIVIQFD